MIIKINFNNGCSEEIIRNTLSELGVEFTEYKTPLQMFYSEEAEYRLSEILDDEDFNNLSEKDKKEIIDSNKEILAENFFSDDEIIDYDYLCSLTRECIVENLTEDIDG